MVSINIYMSKINEWKEMYECDDYSLKYIYI